MKLAGVVVVLLALMLAGCDRSHDVELFLRDTPEAMGNMVGAFVFVRSEPLDDSSGVSVVIVKRIADDQLFRAITPTGCDVENGAVVDLRAKRIRFFFGGVRSFVFIMQCPMGRR